MKGKYNWVLTDGVRFSKREFTFKIFAHIYKFFNSKYWFRFDNDKKIYLPSWRPVKCYYEHPKEQANGSERD